MQPRPIPTTGSALGDALIPAALAFVDAVHRQDKPAALDAVADAQKAAQGDPYWVWAWSCTLAALVPVDARLSELLAWTEPAPAPQGRARRAATRKAA
jgi:hypothetical protein